MLTLIAGFTVAYWTGVPATLARRVAIWLNPWDNARTGGDQIAHALWAMASGGIGGMGAGAGDGYLVPAGQTDLILSVVGEELGLAGVVVIGVVYALLDLAHAADCRQRAWRLHGLPGARLRAVARRARHHHRRRPARRAAAVGRRHAVSDLRQVLDDRELLRRRDRAGDRHASSAGAAALARQLRPVGWTLGAAAVLLVGRAAWIQAASADDIALRPTVVRDADGEVRYRYNPRLLAAARLMPRGSIVDRNGLALATGEPAQADATIGRLRKLRVERVADCLPGTRCYPLGGLAFHVTGEAVHQMNWAARNASFVERDANATLQGFDDRAHAVEVRLRDGRTHTLIAHDYSELLPLMRHKRDPSHAAVRRMLDKPRDVRLTLDGPLQAAVAQALEPAGRAVRAPGGAAVVVDVATGAVLASASYPWPELDESDEAGPPAPAELLDRGRYGLYPPGSTFKLIAAAAALTEEGAARTPTFVCERLADGRVGAHVRGASRPIRDDLTDNTPHGRVDLRKGLVVSCNAYFAQLAMHLGPQAIAVPPRRRRFRSLRLPRACVARCRTPATVKARCSPARCAWRAPWRPSPATAASTKRHRAARSEDYGDERAVAAPARCRVPARRDARSRHRRAPATCSPRTRWRLPEKPAPPKSRGRLAFVVRRLCPGGGAAHRLCGRGRERRIRRPRRRAARGRHRLGGPRYGSDAMKQFVDRARQLSKTMAGRLRRAVDPPLASDATPLEIRHSIIESIESRVQPSGGGRRMLPDSLVDVKIVAADPAAQRALRTVLDDVQSGVLERLKELSCEVPAGFRVQVTYLKRPPSGWPPDRQLTIEYQHLQAIEPAAREHPS